MFTPSPRVVFFVFWLASAGTATANPQDVIAGLLATYQDHSGIPVARIADDELRQLHDGEVIYRTVTMPRSNSGNDDSTLLRIIGYRYIDKPRESLWLAALAYDAGYSRRLTEYFVGYRGRGGASWYQHVNMPWPLRNRHWLIETGKDLALAQRTDNLIWEHYWQLVDEVDARIDTLFTNASVPGLDRHDSDKAITLPLNNGAWVMARVSDSQTLVIVHATLDMGGIIPEGLVARYTRRQLDAMLGKIERDADGIWQRYNDRYIIYRGDGTPIPTAVTSAGKNSQQ